MCSKPFTTPFSHPPCPKPLFIPVWWGQLGVTRLHRSLDSTPLLRQHRWIPSSLYTTQLPRVHRVPRSLIESVAYCTAPTAQLHSSDTTQRGRVRRVLHNVVEFILLYTTAKREVSSKGNGRRPGEGGRSDWRK